MSSRGRTAVPGASGRTSVPGASGRTTVPGTSGRTTVPGASGRTSVPAASGRTSVPAASGRTSVPAASGRIQAFSGLSSLPQGLFFGQKVRLRIFGPAFGQIWSDFVRFVTDLIRVGRIWSDYPGSKIRIQDPSF